ncbi:hypothetical protein Bbelb_305100 [Branchiostoma belcheri]|nr:hypothetical protein Bbelb_305100 [Branchiostoma belcheri]
MEALATRGRDGVSLGTILRCYHGLSLSLATTEGRSSGEDSDVTEVEFTRFFEDAARETNYRAGKNTRRTQALPLRTHGRRWAGTVSLCNLLSSCPCLRLSSQPTELPAFIVKQQTGHRLNNRQSSGKEGWQADRKRVRSQEGIIATVCHPQI